MIQERTKNPGRPQMEQVVRLLSQEVHKEQQKVLSGTDTGTGSSASKSCVSDPTAHIPCPSADKTPL